MPQLSPCRSRAHAYVAVTFPSLEPYPPEVPEVPFPFPFPSPAPTFVFAWPRHMTLLAHAMPHYPSLQQTPELIGPKLPTWRCTLRAWGVVGRSWGRDLGADCGLGRLTTTGAEEAASLGPSLPLRVGVVGAAHATAGPDRATGADAGTAT